MIAYEVFIRFLRVQIFISYREGDDYWQVIDFLCKGGILVTQTLVKLNIDFILFRLTADTLPM